MNLPDRIVVPDDAQPDRADRILVDCIRGEVSRSSMARLIRLGRALLNGRPIRPSTVLNPGDQVEIVQVAEPESLPEPQHVPAFVILHEDPDLIVVDKPAGLVVHPGAGRPAATLMDELVATRPEMVGVGDPGRWGVVHRLDRDTSGVLVLAKTSAAHAVLCAQFKEHTVHRIYLALVRGTPGEDSGIVAAPLGRHARDRKRISISATRSRPAVTRWRVMRRYGSISLLEVTPETGRTHQIRVHLASVGLPVLGDQIYGKPRRSGRVTDPAMRKALSLLKRQALHAAVLGFKHPRDLQYVEFSSPVASDMASAIKMCLETPPSWENVQE
ncbi:MAG: RluA family pseudouridine synthase [Deltaproteobacteria bacterium]|nr:RluA family pseudouridine synthase [Deltaproteobacteria bacterium]